jgi:uncharacterized protein involved in exopolysaccharide biosynthesis
MIQMETRFLTRRDTLSFSLRDLAAPLFRRKRVLIATFLVAFLLVILAGILMPPQFTSHMSVLVNRERLDPLVTTEAMPQLLNVSSPLSEEEINSEAELLKSSDVLEKVVLANGLQDLHQNRFLEMLHPKRDEAGRVARAVRTLAKTLKVEATGKTNLIEVTYSSPDPRLSYAVLKALGDLYVEKHIQVHERPGSYEFFAQEAQRYHEALEDSENKLRRFGEQQGAAAPDLERTNMAVQVTSSIGQLHLVQEAIAGDEQRIRSDQQQMHVTPERSPTQQASSPADRLIDGLQATLLAAQTKRTQLALKYDASYPLVQEADQEIAQAKDAIAEAEKTRYVTQATDRDPTFELLREDLARAKADLAAQHASLAVVRSSIESMQSQMVDLDQKSLTQRGLLREAKANEDNYLLYLSKREQERTSTALDKTRIANVAIAIPPAIPVLPGLSVLFVVQFALGLATVLAIVLAYAVDYFDPSFHTPAEAIDILGIPLVVGMPKRTA